MISGQLTWISATTVRKHYKSGGKAVLFRVSRLKLARLAPSDEFVPPEPEVMEEDEAELELQKQLEKQRKLKQKQLLKDSGEKVSMCRLFPFFSRLNALVEFLSIHMLVKIKCLFKTEGVKKSLWSYY